jgi:hypothetical protein
LRQLCWPLQPCSSSKFLQKCPPLETPPTHD